MIVLGLNSFGHDAAAVLIVDGRVAFASSQERFDRVRHSAAFPIDAIEAALAREGATRADLAAVAFPWPRGMGRMRKAVYWLSHLPRSMAYWRDPPDALLPDRRGYLRAMTGLGRALKHHGIDAPLRWIPHHRAHAFSARLALPEGLGAVLTADGMGAWTTAATWRAEKRGVRRLRRARYPHSPGKAYAAVTAWLGFRPESDEGKTMGLAAYGTLDSAGARFARTLVEPDAQRLLRVDLPRFGFPWGEGRLYGDAFLEALGPARSKDEELRDGDADVARGIQDAVEQFALDAARRLIEETRCASLALAGGLFLNCALNGRLLRSLDVPVLPFPVAGDAGAAWGAAAAVYEELAGRQAAPLGTLALGHEVTATEAEAAASGTGARRLRDVEELALAVARRIAAGRIIAVARGRAEFGPRALGNRSILASPTTTASRDRVNALKGREAWRPLAPIVRLEDDAWFEGLVPSPAMILTFRATKRGRRKIPGVVHEDGTARVQTVADGESEFLRALLDALESAGEPPIVINTSLNRRGEPIVNTAEQAVAAVEAMDLDGLVVGNWLIDRAPWPE